MKEPFNRFSWKVDAPEFINNGNVKNARQKLREKSNSERV